MHTSFWGVGPDCRAVDELANNPHAAASALAEVGATRELSGVISRLSAYVLVPILGLREHLHAVSSARQQQANRASNLRGRPRDKYLHTMESETLAQRRSDIESALKPWATGRTGRHITHLVTRPRVEQQRLEDSRGGEGVAVHHSNVAAFQWLQQVLATPI